MYEKNGIKHLDGYMWKGPVLLRYFGVFPFNDVPEAINIGARVSGITEIGEGAFYHAYIEGARLPDTLKIIGKRAFKNCPNLQRLVIPEGVTEIRDSAFENCKKLKEVRLPSTLKSIGDFAFAGCESLQKLELPEALETVGEFAFAESGLKEIVFGDKVREIGRGACYRCRDLERAVLPPAKIMPAELFYDCLDLKYCTVPEGIEYLGQHMFHGCAILTAAGSIVLPASIQEIDSAFDDNDVDTFTIYAPEHSYAHGYAQRICAIALTS